MTEETAVTIAEIRTLVAERQRFDEWLTALEAKRAATPVRVFDRVHGDYLARRDAVIAHLHEHVGTLESLERELNGRLQQLDTQLAEREDERAEAMLRTAVGEFDADRWESTRHDVESSLAELGQQREALMAEADDTRALLASARHRPAPLELETIPEAVPEPIAAPSMAPAAELPHVERFATPAAAYAASGNSGSAIEAAFAVSPEITDEYASPVADVRADDRSTEVAHAAAMTSQIDSDVDAAVNALDAMPGATVPESLDNIDVYGDPGASTRNSAAPSGAAPRSSDSRPAWTNEAPANGTATRDTFDDLAFLRSVTDTGTSNGASANATQRGGAQGDQTKTLRCTECGTMNFPTEWYCERCGGELAAF